MSRPVENPAGAERPTRVRFTVLAFACTVAMLTYLDRTCVASAAGHFQAAFGLKNIADLKWALAAFPLAYALFEVPNGWLADVFGPRRALLRIVLWWSACTAILGLMGLSVGGWVLGGLGTMIAVQFLCGMGEAGAFPNISRALYNWFPSQERGLTQGAVWSCGRLMGGLTPLVWMVLVEGVARPGAAAGESQLLPPLVHWRAAFWIFGLLGLVWCVFFALKFRSRPEENPRVNAAELAWIHGEEGRKKGTVPICAQHPKGRSGKWGLSPFSAAKPQGASHARVPWGRLLANPSLWVLCLMYACQSSAWYFYITYLPDYFERRYQVAPDSLLGAIYKGGPLLAGAVACLLGGLASDALIRSGHRRWGRRLLGVLGHTSTCICFLCFSLAPTPFYFFLIVSLAGFSTDLTMGSAWAICQDIGGRYVAICAGCMNMLGNLGGALSSWGFGYILQTIGLAHGDAVNFLIGASLYAIGVLCWLRIDATHPLVPE